MVVFGPDKELAGKTITVRQTKNPFVRAPQYIAYRKVTLDERGWLNLRTLGLESELDLVAMRPGEPVTSCRIIGGIEGFFPAALVREALEGGEGEFVTVVGVMDTWDAGEWQQFVLEYESSERRKAYWSGVFERVCAPVARWVGGGRRGDTHVDQPLLDHEVPGRNSGGRDSGSLEVVTERPNVLYGSGLTHRQRGGTPTD